MSYEDPHFDDSPEDAESLKPPSDDSPFIVLETSDARYILTRENTKVCKFKEGRGEFDHLIHSIPNSKDEAFFQFFGQMEAGEQLKAQLEECDYDVDVSPSLDGQTIGLYAQMQGEQLPDTIPESLLG